MNKYKVMILVGHIEYVYAENENEARDQAEMKVFEEKVNVKNGDTIRGFLVTPLREDAIMDGK